MLKFFELIREIENDMKSIPVIKNSKCFFKDFEMYSDLQMQLLITGL